MPRFPPQVPSQLNGDQRKAYDEFNNIAENAFGKLFVTKREDGALVGPFAAFYDAPEVSLAYVSIVVALSKVPDLPKSAREVAILAVGSKYKAVYEIYAHERVAATTGLSKAQIDAIKNGEKPGDLDEGCNIAFDVTMELVDKPGPLSDTNWKRAVEQFGRRGAFVLANYVGYYMYTCCLLNACDIPLPEGEKIL